MIRFAKSIFVGEQGRTCRRRRPSDHGIRRRVSLWLSKAPSHPCADHHGRFPSRVCGVTLAQRRTRCGMPFAHNDIQLLVAVRRRHGLLLCRFAVHKPVAASQIQLAPLASCGCSRAASVHQRHSHLCATDAASFSRIVSRFAGQRTRHLPSLAQHSDPSVP